MLKNLSAFIPQILLEKIEREIPF